MKFAERLRQSGGMTLIELAVATALFGTVVAIAGPVMTSAFDSGRAVDNESRALDEIRIAVARIDRELRSAECIDAPAVGSSGSTLSFTTAADGTPYDVTYSVSGDSLLRTTADGTQPIGTGVEPTGDEFQHSQTTGQRASVEVVLNVKFEDEHAARSVATTITGRNAWAACP